MKAFFSRFEQKPRTQQSQKPLPDVPLASSSLSTPPQNQVDETDRDDPIELTRMIGYLTATASEDWSLVLEVCERASSSEANAKEATKALRRELKYGAPSAQLSAARLWAIILRNSGEVFAAQTLSRKFLDTVEDVVLSPRTSPVVRERLLEVIAAAAFASAPDSKGGFRALWRKVRPPDKPEAGVPFDDDDAMLSPPAMQRVRVSQERASTSSRAHHRRRRDSAEIVSAPEDRSRRLFEECRIGDANAALLVEALSFASPEDVKNKRVIRELYTKCRESQAYLAAKVPWAYADAERSRLDAESYVVLQNGEVECTAREQHLATMLATNKKLLSVLQMFDDLERAAHELGNRGRDRLGRPETPPLPGVDSLDHPDEPLIEFGPDVDIGARGEDRPARPDTPLPAVDSHAFSNLVLRDISPHAGDSSPRGRSASSPSTQSSVVRPPQASPTMLHAVTPRDLVPDPVTVFITQTAPAHHIYTSPTVAPHGPRSPAQASPPSRAPSIAPSVLPSRPGSAASHIDEEGLQPEESLGRNETTNLFPNPLVSDVVSHPSAFASNEEPPDSFSVFSQDLPSYTTALRQPTEESPLEEATEVPHPPPEYDIANPYRDLTGQVVKIEEQSFAIGGSADIYKGKWTDSTGNAMIVVIKILRILGMSSDPDVLARTRKYINRETAVWMRLKHRHVLPFLGVCCDLGPSHALIAPYCEGGDVLKYLQRVPGANRLGIVSGVTSGLQYLHSQDVIHGDLKCENVLIKKNGDACICDFGISKIVDRRGFTTILRGTWAFTAPELFCPSDDESDEGTLMSATKPSDVFAYGLVALQILTGKPPAITWLGNTNATGISRRRYVSAVVGDALWEIFASCCAFEAGVRPAMGEVVQRLGHVEFG